VTYDGPLDWLLQEVRRQNVPVEQIAMAPLVAGFLEYIQSAADHNVNLDMEWLYMAATLIHWKSRALLPQDSTQAAEPDRTRDELVEQLLMHHKKAAEQLGVRQSLETARFSRTRSPGNDEEEPAFWSVWDMIGQAREISHWASDYRMEHRHWHEMFPVEYEGITIAEMTDYLRGRLLSDRRVDGAELMRHQPTEARRCCFFLAMLEMTRDQQIVLQQVESFGSIWITSIVNVC